MSLGAIDFIMVVDGSVVMVENIVQKLRAKEKKEDTDSVIIKAAQQLARPIFFGVLIILMVYVPIMTFKGMEESVKNADWLSRFIWCSCAQWNRANFAC